MRKRARWASICSSEQAVSRRSWAAMRRSASGLSLAPPEAIYATMTLRKSPGTLLELLEPIAGERTALALPEDGTRVSYASLREQVRDAADVFAGLGIGRGDRVAMALPNGLPAIVCFLGDRAVAPNRGESMPSSGKSVIAGQYIRRFCIGDS